MARASAQPAAAEPSPHRAADTRGRWAEALAEQALTAAGWSVLARRFRSPAGEIDLIARKAGLVAFVEVKCRRTGAEAAFALTERQRRRIIGAAEHWLAEHPSAGPDGLRFDVLLVDRSGNVRRVADAFRMD